MSFQMNSMANLADLRQLKQDLTEKPVSNKVRTITRNISLLYMPELAAQFQCGENYQEQRLSEIASLLAAIIVARPAAESAIASFAGEPVKKFCTSLSGELRSALAGGSVAKVPAQLIQNGLKVKRAADTNAATKTTDRRALLPLELRDFSLFSYAI